MVLPQRTIKIDATINKIEANSVFQRRRKSLYSHSAYVFIKRDKTKNILIVDVLNSNEKEYIKCQQFLVVIISLPYEIITQQFKRYVKTSSEIFYSIFMLIVYH